MRRNVGPAQGPAWDGPHVVLAGRPNVGKSTVFNRIVGGARSVVEAEPGVTRDRVTAPAEWAGHPMVFSDTGGVGGAGDAFAAAVAGQADEALAEADCILFVVDAAAGLLPEDRAIAARLRRLRMPVVLVANKCDRRDAVPDEFFALGLGTPCRVSASRGEGVGDALDEVVARLRDVGRLPEAPMPVDDDAAARVRVGFVGRPNVGKSSLVNRLLGQQRLIVSEIAGTTRDAVDVPWDTVGRHFLLVDTPGLRRPSKLPRHGLERDSSLRSLQAIARSEVVALVLDANEPCTDQDRRIAGAAVDRHRAIVLVLNKVDRLDVVGRAAAEERIRETMPFLAYAVLVACSALTGHGLASVPAALAAAADAFACRLPTPVLNACVRAAVAERPPAAVKGRSARIYYTAQVGTAPPTVALVTSASHAVPRDYARYLENRLRERFPLEGTPVRLVFRARPHRRLLPSGTVSLHRSVGRRRADG